MTPQEAGQIIRALTSVAQQQLITPEGTPTVRKFATATGAARIITTFLIYQLPELAPYIGYALDETLKSARFGEINSVVVNGYVPQIAKTIVDFVANEVEKQLSLQAAANTPSPPIVAIPDTLESAQQRAEIALLNRLAKAAEDGTGEHELRQISEAYLNVTKEGVETSDRPNAAQLGALLMRAEGLRAAQDVLQKAGLDIQQHPANAVQILVDQRDEALRTAKTLENDMVTARKIAEEIGAERDSRVTEANATISTLETELVKAQQARAALQGTVNELASDAAKLQIAMDQANFRYEGVRRMLDELGKRMFDRLFDGHIGHKEWPKTHIDDASHADMLQAVPNDVRAQFAATLTLVRYLANSEKVANAQAGSTCAKLRNDIAMSHQYLDNQHIQDGTIFERVQVFGVIRDALAKDGFNSDNLPGLVETVLESLREAQKERDTLTSKLDEIQTLLVGNGFVAESAESPQFAVHGVTWLLDALSEAQNERDIANAEVSRLKGLALVNDVSSMHEALNDAAIPAGHIVNRVRGLVAHLGSTKMLQEAVAEVHQVLDEAKIPNGNLVKRVRAVAVTATNLRAELDAANEQTSLQSRTIRNLAVLLDAEDAGNHLFSLVRGLWELTMNWRNDTRVNYHGAAAELEHAMKGAISGKYDALMAATKANESATAKAVLIGVALASGSNGDLVPAVFTPPANRPSSEF